MNLLGRILKPGILQSVVHYSNNQKIKAAILNSRGNLDQNFPSDFTENEKEDIGAVQAYTMTSLERMVCLSRAVDWLVSNRVEGDIVECGVWKGGSMMLIAKRLLRQGVNNKNLFLFDTFEGMPAPGAEDVSVINQETAKELLDKSEKLQGDNVWCYSSLEEVKSNLQRTQYPAEHIFYIQGKVEDTLPHEPIQKISLLRLDTDWYESTRHELETLYDRLVVGGMLIIDDYGHWSGARQAVDEFVADRGLRLFFNRMDYTGRIAIKTP
jgi:O-methyltransferase